MNEQAALNAGGPAQFAVRFAKGTVSFARQKPLGAMGSAVVVALLVIAIFDPLIATFPTLETHLTDRNQGPSATYIFGTDNLGRDVFSRLVSSTKSALFVSILSVVFGVALGSVFGLVSAFFGGAVDLAVQRVMDGLLALPALIMAMSVAAALHGRADVNLGLIIAIAVINVPVANRLVRATVLSIKEEVYIEAANALGASPLRIMVRHITPNTLAPILVLMTNQFAWAIIVAASLAFLGLGPREPTPTWGLMLTDGIENAERSFWPPVITGLVVFITILSFIMIGDAIRDLMDPRLRGSTAGPGAQGQQQ